MKDVEKAVARAVVRAGELFLDDYRQASGARHLHVPRPEARVLRCAVQAVIEALAEAEAEERQGPLRCDDAAPATPRLLPTPDSYYNGKPR